MKPSAEALWLGVFTGAGAIGAVWLGAGLPVPGCPFYAVTGLPCPACGSTRAFRCIAALDVAGALRVQPLFTAVMLGIVAYCAYAAGVLSGLWKPWVRPPPLPAEMARWRMIAVLALVASWAYLAWREIR